MKTIITSLPDLEKELDKVSNQLELFKKSTMDVQSAFTRLELFDTALLIRVSMLELRVAALEKENKQLKAFG